MRTRLIRLGASLAALAALAFGGSAIASAAQSGNQAPPPPAAVGEQGNQAAPDNPAEANASADTDNVQQGDQTAADTGSAAEQGGESEPGATGGPDTDAAAQAAACNKAGIDSNADNVQYDDQTGTCALDTGANSQQGN